MNKKRYYIIIVILLIVLIYALKVYKENDFNEFTRGEKNLYTSEFKRDNTVKYGNKNSYKIKSDDYNDAMFYKAVKVNKNQPYKVTCMVKTNNVEGKDSNSGIGAQIAISETDERSVAVSGTSDWQKIELIFNSKDREEVNIGFRLGGYLGEAKGEAWFSDFTIEEGTEKSDDNTWNFGCFIFETTDVTINGERIKLDVSSKDISDIEDTIRRFGRSCSELSQGKMNANCDIYKIETPLTTLSYDEEYGYYASPEDVENQIKDITIKNDYDHIFIILRLGDEQHEDDIQIKDWIGLGSMDYYGIGYSNIRLPNSSKSYIYKYYPGVNTFPEEVFLHEFLHSLERNAEEYGYERPELHDYEKYGHKNEAIIGQKKWYKDYMNKEIKTSDGNYIGLPKEIYTLKPAKSSDFIYSYEIKNEFKEPENLIEEIKLIFKKIKNNVKIISKVM